MDFVYKKKKNVSIIEADMIKRTIAFLIDFIIFSFISFGVLMIMGRFNIISPEFAYSIYYYRTNIYEYPEYFNTFKDVLIHIIISLFFISYFALFESEKIWGQSLGKKILKIKVVDQFGDGLSIVDSYKRNSTKYFLRLPVIGIPFGLMELVLIFLYSKRTGDFLANTFVASSIKKGTYTGVKKGDEFYFEDEEEEDE
ncbi:MAG: RDD family protein [Thermoplasmatota archaeon]